MHSLAVGISGWRYPTFRGVFYPQGLRQADELAYVSRRFNSVEINGAFYSLQRPSSYIRWREEVPEGFVFAVKGGRFITHNKKLLDCRSPLANFFASGVLALEEKLGPILWQLPPQLPFRADRLRDFFALLPRTTREAAVLGRDHDDRLRHGAWLDVRVDRPIRYALEIRHPSYEDPAFYRLLREAGIALCVSDAAGTWPMLEALTTNFVYVRLHGDKELYVSGYERDTLDRWAKRIERWRANRDVYVYFDNDVNVRAPFDALNLAKRLDRCHGTAEPLRNSRAARRCCP